MKTEHLLWTLAAVGLLVVGAAYGNRIPVVKQAAKALPGSNVL